MTEPTAVPTKTVFKSVKNKVVSAKNFVKKHRVAIAVVTTTLVVGSLNVRNQKHYNEFLTEHGLLETYYDMSEDVPADVTAL